MEKDLVKNYSLENFKNLYEKEQQTFEEVNSLLKFKIIKIKDWNYNIIDVFEIKNLFNNREISSDLLGIYKLIDNELFFFINLNVNKFTKNIENLQINTFFSPSKMGFTNQLVISDQPETFIRFISFDYKELYEGDLIALQTTQKLSNPKKINLVLCTNNLPKNIVWVEPYFENSNNQITDFANYSNFKNIELVDYSLHIFQLLDNQSFDKYLALKDILKINWSKNYVNIISYCWLLKNNLDFTQKTTKELLDEIKKNKLIDIDEFNKFELNLKKIFDVNDQKKLIEFNNYFFSNHSNVILSLRIIFSEGTTFFVPKDYLQFLGRFLLMYLISPKITKNGEYMPFIDLFEERKIRTKKIDYLNLPNPEDFGLIEPIQLNYWNSFFNVMNSNQSFNANLFDVLEEFDCPIPNKVYSKIFKNIKVDDPEKVDELCSKLLEEAHIFKSWSLNNGAYFAIKFGPFKAVQLFEIYEDIYAKFITDNNFFYYYMINVQTLKSTNDYILEYEIGKENAYHFRLALKQIVCALVRDYWVVEKKESIFSTENIKHYKYLPKSYKENPYKIIYLPKVIYEKKKTAEVCFDGMQYRERSNHFVRQHLRISDTISATQKYLAEKYGIKIPDGYTFVKSHWRGTGQEKQIIYRSKSALQMIYEKKIISPEKNKVKFFQFEIDVKKILENLNIKIEHYSANRRNDGGVDLIGAKKIGDKILTYLVQCKCYSPSNKIGPNIIRELAGSMMKFEEMCEGIVITTSTLTADSIKEISDFLKKGIKITFIDGNSEFFFKNNEA